VVPKQELTQRPESPKKKRSSKAYPDLPPPMWTIQKEDRKKGKNNPKETADETAKETTRSGPVTKMKTPVQRRQERTNIERVGGVTTNEHCGFPWDAT